MTNYVLATVSNFAGKSGYHEYLPTLYGRDSESMIIQAIGLASLTNAGKNPETMKSAEKLYLHGVRKVRQALAHSTEVRCDATLTAVMMIGIFEVTLRSVGCGVQRSIINEVLVQHFRGLTSLINISGLEQFQNEEALRLFP